MNMYAARQHMDRITDDDWFNACETVLSCILADNDMMKECEGLEAEDFFDPLHQIIFDNTRRLRMAGQAVNSVSLKPFLPKVMQVTRPASAHEVKPEQAEQVIPAQYVFNAMISGTSPALKAKFPIAIQTIKSASLSAYAGREGSWLLEFASEGHSVITLSDELDAFEQRFKERKARLTELQSGTSAGSAYLAMFQASSKADGVVGVPIALPEIANVLSEPVFESGNLYGLLSSSGEGKSSLTMQLIYHAVRQGHPVQFLSYDQSAAQCIRQMIAQAYGISVAQQRDPMGKMSDSEREKCVKFAMWMDKQPLEIIRCQREGVTQLLAYARRFVKRHTNGKTPFVVIDHIGKIKPRDPKLSPDRISGEVTVELKSFADEVGAAILILNQRNTAGTIRDNPRPISRDLYGGEGAKADYDSVMYLYRPAKYKADREATAAKDSDFKMIQKVFGQYGEDIDSIAEIGVIKSRFSDPNLRETLTFDAKYTRYVSKPGNPQGRML